MHSYPFNVSNLVKIFEDCVVRSSVGKCAALFICDNNPLGHAFMFNILSATDLMSSGGKCHFRNEFRRHSVFTYMQLQCLSALWLLHQRWNLKQKNATMNDWWIARRKINWTDQNHRLSIEMASETQLYCRYYSLLP